MLTRKQVEEIQAKACPKCGQADIIEHKGKLIAKSCANCFAYTFDGEVWISPPSSNWRNGNGD